MAMGRRNRRSIFRNGSGEELESLRAGDRKPNQVDTRESVERCAAVCGGRAWCRSRNRRVEFVKRPNLLPKSLYCNPLQGCHGRPGGGPPLAFPDPMTAAPALDRTPDVVTSHDEKMNAVARVATGIARGIGGGAESATLTLLELLDELPTAHPAYERLEDLRDSLQRIASVTRQLGAFARRVPADVMTDLNQVVERTRPLLERLAGPVVAVAFDHHDDALPIRCEGSAVEQMLFHLVVNARDAMPHGGSVRIDASRRSLPIAFRHRHGVLPAGDWAMLEVADSGQGMTADVLEHLFEPFFTTKDAGFGTGLGLSTVYAVMRQTGGHVIVASEPDHGTTVTLAWPIADAPSRISDCRTGDAAVLVVDGDAWVRTVAGRVLRRAGLGVLEAESALSALELMRGVAGPAVRLVLSDARVRGVDGSDFANQLGHEFPGIPLVVMTGPGRAALLAHHAGPVLTKPFTQDELLRAVHLHVR